MYSYFFRYGDHFLNSWVVLAIMGFWGCFFSIREDLRTKKFTYAQIYCFLALEVLVFFVGLALGQFLTVGRVSVRVGSEVSFSGMVLYGGVISCFLVGYSVWKGLGWNRQLSQEEFFDFGSLALAWACFFGRIGCTLYGCCYGTPSGNWPGYFLNFDQWDHHARAFPREFMNVRLHPAPLYEAMAWLGIISFTYWARAQNKKTPGTWVPGMIGLVGWIFYGIIRFLLEFIRADPRGELVLGFSPSQEIAVVTVVAALMRAWVLQHRFHDRLHLK